VREQRRYRHVRWVWRAGHQRRWSPSCRGALVGVLAVLAVALGGPASASAARLYVNFGDSLAAGAGATPGHSYIDLYCAYLKSAAGGSLVDQCVNESAPGASTQSALDSGMIQKVVNEIQASTDTPVVTVSLGAGDWLGIAACRPITTAGCKFMHNMRTILGELETALATHPGPHVIKWLEYYNFDHNNPFGYPKDEQNSAVGLLGNDLAFTDCSSEDLNLIGLDDAINCIAKEKGATPVDIYTPFQNGCTNKDCFSDDKHPNDKGHGLIFDALRDTPGTPVPATPPPDTNWPLTVPQNTSAPAVTGAPRLGSVLSCSLGSWSGTTPLTYAVQWVRDQSPVPGQTRSTYLVGASDIGHAMSCRVTASNQAGSVAGRSNSLKIAAVRATINALSETRSVFAPSDPHHKRGTVFSFRLDQPAEVKIAIQLQVPGRRVGQSCRQPTAPLRHKPPCTRTIPITTLIEHGHAGLNKIAFSGRIRGRALTLGRYIAVFTAVNRAGESKAHSLHFTIVSH
jgi:lysophospholipase L1-like esterase